MGFFDLNPVHPSIKNDGLKENYRCYLSDDLRNHYLTVSGYRTDNYANYSS